MLSARRHQTTKDLTELECRESAIWLAGEVEREEVSQALDMLDSSHQCSLLGAVDFLVLLILDLDYPVNQELVQGIAYVGGHIEVFDTKWIP